MNPSDEGFGWAWRLLFRRPTGLEENLNDRSHAWGT